MKTRFTLIGIVAAVVMACSMLFVGCNDPLGGMTLYSGKVVYSGTTTPFPDLEVKVTNGEKSHCVSHTDENGAFSLMVKVDEIDGNYYLLVGDSSCITKRMNLSGYGQAEVDLGTIEITGPTLPTVTTKGISNISDNKATSGGNVTADGRSAVTARGVCWSKSEYPTVDGDHTTNGSGKGEFTSQITGLEAGATYYVRAYATNKQGTAYGEQLTLSTATGLPQVTTDEVSEISATTAVCGGDVAANSGYPITGRGLCWSDKSATPTISNDHTEEVATTGKFSSMMIGLKRNTTYYVRAYAVNEKGVGYGNAVKFTTTDGLPQVTTGNVSNITATTANVSANVVSAGDGSLSACGVCWSKSTSSPTLSEPHTSEVAKVGEFTSNMTNLKGNTTYYVRAYATNQSGTIYGNTVSFHTATTSDGLPIVTTLDPGENITTTTISTGGNVTNDGGFAVTECGVVYSTLPYPSLSNASKVVGGSGVGYYSATIRNLSLKYNTYYIRAYATNINGTSYGNQITITPERIEYLYLKTMVYGGYTYRIKPIGTMTWQDGYDACQNMVYGGYDDWFMPDVGEVEAILRAYQLWDVNSSYESSLKIEGCSSIWTSEASGYYASYYYIYHNSNYTTYWWSRQTGSYKSSIRLIIAVRKY